ncbi:MAG: histidine phosphatase family protein [Arenicella sp.]
MKYSVNRYINLTVKRLNLLVFMMIFSTNISYANDKIPVWDLLKSGNHFAMVRHAIAPGTGDPSNFKIGDCSTQRNLSDEGKHQAKSIGKRFRENGIENVNIFSSQWCRCLETAQLLSLGPVQELPPLNSFFRDSENGASQTQALKEWLSKKNLSTPTLLVTHQVNITELTGIYPRAGEMVIVERTDSGELIVIGRHQGERK